jgi:hypothetical protein
MPAGALRKGLDKKQKPRQAHENQRTGAFWPLMQVPSA